MIVFTRLTPRGAYASDVLPGLIVIGLGMGCIFAPAFSTATLGVDRQDAGVASAMVNTSQQVGGSVGTALLSTLFASAAASYAARHAHLAGRRSRRRSTAKRWRSGGPRDVRRRPARRAGRASRQDCVRAPVAEVSLATESGR